MVNDVSSILDYFHKLEEVNLEDVRLNKCSSQDRKTTRKDESSKNNSEMSEKLLKLAPQRKERFIKVKSVFN